MTAKIVAPERGLLKLVDIPGKGRGVVTTRKIARGKMIEAAPVIPLTKKDHPHPESVLSHYPFEWKTKPYRTAFGLGYVGLINHSDEPNCRVEADIENEVLCVYAIKAIAPGTELTWDYGVKPWFDVSS